MGQYKESSKLKNDPTLNIWQANDRLVLQIGKEELVVKKNELLFLVNSNSKSFVFKTENGEEIRVPIKFVKERKISLLFCTGMSEDATK